MPSAPPETAAEGVFHPGVWEEDFSVKRKNASKARRPETRKRRVRYDEAGFPRRFLRMLIFAVVTALLVEGFNQSTVPRMLQYLSERTFFFFLNCLIVLTTLAVSELFKHRKAMVWTISTLWVILGAVNMVVSHNRTLPLIGGDLFLTWEVVSLITVYFSWTEIILMFVCAVALIAAIVWLFTNTARRRRVNRYFGAGVVAVLALFVFLVHMSAIKAGLMPDTFPDRVTSYRDYGFTTCFSFTFGQRGISKPDAYSTETVEEIMTEIEEEPQPAAAPTPVPAAARFDEESRKKPNIVFLQLESFFDVNTVLDASLSRDPTPNFHALIENWPSALLYVPTVGGGTANVEFEVMSGMNMDFFGAGETPYNSIIQETTCETIADTLRGHGYASTALHNNTGTFFSRNEVYANLGYDRFVCLEYMHDVEYNEVGWAGDAALTNEILTAMRNSEERDLIFAITVESHGKYRDDFQPDEDDIHVFSAPEEMYQAAFADYVNRIPAVDDFIGDILAQLENYDEPVIVLLYGDHLPGVGLTPEMLESGDFYASRYVIWNNYGAEFEAPAMQAYRLSAELLRQLGISDGVMTKFHQSYPVDEEGEDYLAKLKTLEYDLLYGDRTAYGSAGAPEPTQLQLGNAPVRAESAAVRYGRLMVTGENFNEFSAVVSGEEVLPTVYIDSEHLAVHLAEDGADKLGDTVCVAQRTMDGGKELSRSGEIAVERFQGHQ